MRVWLIADTHMGHNQLVVPPNIDMIIHAGDASNARDVTTNSVEMRNFFDWYENIDVPFKVFVPGNHDTSVEHGLFKSFSPKGIDVLIHESRVVNGIKLFGSPFTPTFGTGWAYNRKRDKLHNYWKEIPEDIDIAVIHGPCKGILDISEDKSRNIEYCGDRALRTRIEQIQPKYFISGHIHSMKGHDNYGTRTIANCSTTFVNCSMVLDGEFDLGIVHSGIIIEL